MMTSTKERSKFLISKVKKALRASNINKHIHCCRQGQKSGDKREMCSIQVRDLTLSVSSKKIQTKSMTTLKAASPSEQVFLIA